MGGERERVKSGKGNHKVKSLSHKHRYRVGMCYAFLKEKKYVVHLIVAIPKEVGCRLLYEPCSRPWSLYISKYRKLPYHCLQS